MRKLTLSLTAALFAALGAAAIEAPLTFISSNFPPMDFHGFASQGFIVNSGHNDYLGGNSSQGTFDFREYGVNASIAYDKWRVGAQFFGQDLGPYGNDKIDLDWGSVDYQAFQWFGLRGGRVKMPHGLYNEALDLDSTRPFVLLPQSVYDARLRDFVASVDGGLAYGNIELKKFGSLDYKIFLGAKSLSPDSGASDYFNIDAPFPNLKLSIDDVWGGSLFWNTPLNGLRVGYSFVRYDGFSTLRYVPFRNENTYKVTDHYDRHLFSAEYTRGNWVFAAEAGFDAADSFVKYSSGVKYAYLYPNNYYGYVSGAYRVNRWLQLGGYYSQYHWDQHGVGTPVAFPSLNQSDYALCARFDITENLLFKLEAHYLYGAGEVFDVPSQPQPPGQRDNSWVMFTAKFTFSF